jgi:hypothetical protein
LRAWDSPAKAERIFFSVWVPFKDFDMNPPWLKCALPLAGGMGRVKLIRLIPDSEVIFPAGAGGARAENRSGRWS